MAKKKIRVLVVDDSAFMRKAIKRMLASDPEISVVGDAGDGAEAVRMASLLKPDVVTMDVRMSGMDGIQALELIMRDEPIPVLMISSLTSEGGETTLKALELGAVDFIDKSSCHTTMDILNIAEQLIAKVKVLAGVDLLKIQATRERSSAPIKAPLPVERDPKNPSCLVAIGSSTGGPMSLEKVLTAIPPDYPGAIAIVQHMPVGFTASLAERMNNLCAIAVKEAEEGDLIQPGRAYIAPGGYHLKFRMNGDKCLAILDTMPQDRPHIPSVDVLMESMAGNWRGRMLGIIMTGMGDDGSMGLRAMKERGATILAQNEATCVVFGMPRAAQMTGAVDRMVPLNLIAREIVDFG